MYLVIFNHEYYYHHDYYDINFNVYVCVIMSLTLQLYFVDHIMTL